MRILRKKIIFFTIMIFVFVGLICLVIYLKNVRDYKQAVREINIDEIDISDISDGVYTGECNVNFIYAKVEVTIQNGEIANINILEHKNERGKGAESITDKIIKEQKIDVDTISGATNSSIVIKKAVENALKGEV